MAKSGSAGASSGKQNLNAVRENLIREVQSEFLKYIENMRTRLLVADVEESLIKFADKYSGVLKDFDQDTEV